MSIQIDFRAGIAEPRIGVIIPSKRVQREMLKVLRSKRYSDLHNTSYNLIANPYTDDYDNCVTHTLKVMTATPLGADDPSALSLASGLDASREWTVDSAIRDMDIPPKKEP